MTLCSRRTYWNCFNIFRFPLIWDRNWDSIPVDRYRNLSGFAGGKSSRSFRYKLVKRAHHLESMLILHWSVKGQILTNFTVTSIMKFQRRFIALSLILFRWAKNSRSFHVLFWRNSMVEKSALFTDTIFDTISLAGLIWMVKKFTLFTYNFLDVIWVKNHHRFDVLITT